MKFVKQSQAKITTDKTQEDPATTKNLHRSGMAQTPAKSGQQEDAPVLIVSDRILSTARMEPAYSHQVNQSKKNSDLPSQEKPYAINQTQFTLGSETEEPL